MRIPEGQRAEIHLSRLFARAGVSRSSISEDSHQEEAKVEN
jgi:hypothetical protein